MCDLFYSSSQIDIHFAFSLAALLHLNVPHGRVSLEVLFLRQRLFHETAWTDAQLSFSCKTIFGYLIYSISVLLREGSSPNNLLLDCEIRFEGNINPSVHLLSSFCCFCCCFCSFIFLDFSRLRIAAFALELDLYLSPKSSRNV